MPYWHTSFQRIATNCVALLEGNWQFDHLDDLPIQLQPHHRDPTASVINSLNDPERRGKNISMYLC